MQAVIENRPVFTTLKLTLAAGETIRAEAGAMVSMSSNVELKSKTQGKGLGGMFKAAIGGEGIFASEFTSSGGPGEVILAPPTPGDILELPVNGQTLFAQGGAYLAGNADLVLGTKGSLKSAFAGEGLFLQTITGNGTVFLSCYGAIIERQVSPGETYVVDTGHLLAFEESVQYKVKMASKGLFSSMASGEGLVAELSGSGRLWIQTRNLSGFAALLQKLLPTKQS